MTKFKYAFDDNKRYHTWNYYLRNTFGEKVFKVSLNGGFTCPNLDGKVSRGGCTYCSNSGSGDFAGNPASPLSEQFNEIKAMMHKKWPNAKYIAYFQAYTNTYAPVEELTRKYEEALAQENVIALSIAYGQKHTKEIEASDKIVKYYNVEHIYLDLAKIFQYSDCSLLSHSDKEIPKESYNDQIKSTNGSPVSTYVPFRNGLFLSSAASIAISKGCSEIYYGAHADDAAGSAYPDCSSDFNNAINEAIYLGSGKQIKVVAPFINATKDQVVKKGLEINVPYKYTWSCYEGGEKPCGKCGTCIDRAKAFELNGIKDPAME